MNEILSTRELASAIGVSESSIKRWVDEGVIRAARTAGGHRRISRAEAIRFIRASRANVIRPDVLGLPDAIGLASTTSGDDAADRLFAFLHEGAAVHARGLVLSLYLSGESVAAIVDGPIRSAMQQVGEIWRHDRAGIFYEHRATEICQQALHQLRLSLPPAEDGPVALGGGPAGDPYALPSLAAATVLAAEGLRSVNLGPNTPFSTLEEAIDELAPRLVWVSASASEGAADLADSLERLAARLLADGIALIVGGRAITQARLAHLPGLHHAGTMAELASFARGFLSR